jgi:putative ABC transport system permease protein
MIDELSYDKFQKEGGRIFRVYMQGQMQDNAFEVAMAPAPMSQALKEEVPEIEDTIRFGIFRTIPMQYED